MSIGVTHSELVLGNNNPAIDLSNLPNDNSIEYNPTMDRESDHKQIQGSITNTNATHTFKVGGLYDDQTGNEQYQFIPASQLAVDALANLDLRLTPAGSFNGQTDSLGNKVYILGPNPVSPVLSVTRSGYYAAAYAQDTWNVTGRFTANYGLRLDAYQQSENLGLPSVDQNNLSPRVNLAYKVAPGTVARASYDQLFTEPPLAQGAILGQPILPQLTKQYEVDLEKQIAPRQTARFSYYIKHDTNQIDVGILIPYTQIGAYTAVNFQEGHVQGSEFSYNLAPRNNQGVSAYLSWTNSLAKPTGLDNTGAPVPEYNDHDQLNTISTGTAYVWRSGASAGLNLYYGSGVASSVLSNIAGNVVLDNGDRQSHAELNLDVSTGPHFFSGNHGGLELGVENLLNGTGVINFNSGFSGTRFLQGRRVMLYGTYSI